MLCCVINMSIAIKITYKVVKESSSFKMRLTSDKIVFEANVNVSPIKDLRVTLQIVNDLDYFTSRCSDSNTRMFMVNWNITQSYMTSYSSVTLLIIKKCFFTMNMHSAVGNNWYIYIWDTSDIW